LNCTPNDNPQSFIDDVYTTIYRADFAAFDQIPAGSARARLLLLVRPMNANSVTGGVSPVIHPLKLDRLFAIQFFKKKKFLRSVKIRWKLIVEK